MNSDRPDQRAKEVEDAYAEHGDALFRFSLNLTGHRDDAEDLVVETFTHAYRQWNSFTNSGTRKAWLYGIAVNRYRMSRRRSPASTEVLHDELPNKEKNTLELIVLQNEIAQLPIKQREAFLLVKSEGLTAKEAAKVLRRPIGTVLYDVHRAIHALRKALNESPTPNILLEVKL